MRHWYFLLMLPKVHLSSLLGCLVPTMRPVYEGGHKSPEMLLRGLVHVDGLAHYP